MLSLSLRTVVLRRQLHKAKEQLGAVQAAPATTASQQQPWEREREKEREREAGRRQTALLGRQAEMMEEREQARCDLARSRPDLTMISRSLASISGLQERAEAQELRLRLAEKTAALQAAEEQVAPRPDLA